MAMRVPLPGAGQLSIIYIVPIVPIYISVVSFLESMALPGLTLAAPHALC
jgi:hypothetical protein